MIKTRTDAKGSTRYRARIKVKDDRTGAWAELNGSWRRSKREALADERSLLGRRERGTLKSTKGQTVDGYLVREWLPSVSKVGHRGKPLAPRTAEKYRHSVRRLQPLIGGLLLTKLRPAHVEDARDALLRTLGPDAVADTIATLSRALDRAVRIGYIGSNPAAADVVRRPAPTKRAHPEVDPSTATRILSAVVGAEPWDAAVHLALGLGLRREEVLALRWANVDLATGEVVVDAAVIETSAGVAFGPPKSENSARTLYAPAFVLDALRRHRKAQNERRLAAGPTWTESDLVVERGGRVIRPSSFSTYWRRWAAAHNLAGIRFHDLRSGTASLYVAAGVPDAAALAAMGHGALPMLRHYQTIGEYQGRDTASRLQGLLYPN